MAVRHPVAVYVICSVLLHLLLQKIAYDRFTMKKLSFQFFNRNKKISIELDPASGSKNYVKKRTCLNIFIYFTCSVVAYDM